jgi:hypothetical protein
MSRRGEVEGRIQLRDKREVRHLMGVENQGEKGGGKYAVKGAFECAWKIRWEEGFRVRTEQGRYLQWWVGARPSL